jgi:hypothetical protein
VWSSYRHCLTGDPGRVEIESHGQHVLVSRLEFPQPCGREPPKIPAQAELERGTLFPIHNGNLVERIKLS